MSKFKIGDYVTVTNRLYSWQEDTRTTVPVGTILRVIDNNEDTSYYCSIQNKTIEIEGLDLDHPEDYFKLVDKLTYEYLTHDNTTPHDISGNIARPILEERKVGKLMIHLFDDGFPNAIWEIAKLMTWANDEKGYRPHDWKQLPNAEVEFAAAASRHRMKPKLGEMYDPESKLLHKAHEAFNVLAELELMLTGKIKGE